MTELKTKPALLDALRDAARRPLSEGELRNQRVSFIMASMKDSEDVTRERVARQLAEHEGRKVLGDPV